MLIASKEVLINSIIFYLDEGCEIDNHRVDPQHVTDKAELLESGVLAFVESWHSGNFSEGTNSASTFFPSFLSSCSFDNHIQTLLITSQLFNSPLLLDSILYQLSSSLIHRNNGTLDPF